MLTYRKQEYKLGKNDMILLKKATAVKYHKFGNAENDNIYDSLMFSIKDDLLKSFLSTSEIKVSKPEGEIKTRPYPMNECLVAFAHFMKPYFFAHSVVHPGQLRLKIMELLYDVAECNRNMFLQILQLHEPIRTDIRNVVEQHYNLSYSCTVSTKAITLSNNKALYSEALNPLLLIYPFIPRISETTFSEQYKRWIIIIFKLLP